MNINLQANRGFREADLTHKRYVVLKGSAGSGKSVDTAQHYILRLLQDKGRNLLCVRKSDVTNRQSTFAELRGAIYRMFGQAYRSYWYINNSAMQIQCKLNGNCVLFRGMNDDAQREKLKSIAVDRGKLTDIWVEEATELTQADFEILDDRLRGELPSGQFYQIRLTFNPVSASHWIKKVFFDRTDADVYTHSSTYLDNRFLDAGFHARMQRRRETDPEGYRIYGLGEWGETGGLILTNWTAQKVSQVLADYDEVSIGQDFGFNHANAIYVLGFKDADVYVLRGLYGFEKDTSEWILEADKAKIPKDRVMWCDSAEPDRIQMWKKAGYRARAVRKEKNSIQAQIDWLKGNPEGADDRAIKRHIYVHPSCVNFIREIEQWRWRRDAKTTTYTDEPVPFQDDAMAALRYGVEGWRKTRAVKVHMFEGGL